jgi:general secretion pathway protein A
VLRIILAGQPELSDKLDNPQLEQLTQRVRLRFHLQTLSESETRGYIRHRLEVAGAGDRALFAPDTFAQIYRYCGGVPRLINTLCDTAMMAAGTADRDVVTHADIESAAAELQWADFAHRPRHHAAEADRLPPPVPVTPAEGGRPALARLLVATDGHTVQEVPLRPGRVIVGRTPDNDVHIDSRFISRHHCQVITTTHSCVVEDLNSTNGIFVKSNRVRRHHLNDGDVVLIGRHELIYVDERAPRPRNNLSDTMPGLQALREADFPGHEAQEEDDDEAEEAETK